MKKYPLFLKNQIIIIALVLLSSLTQCQNKSLINYKDTNVSFTYPAKWETASSDIKSAFQKQLNEQLNVYDGKILELEIFILESANSAMLVFDKAKVADTLTMDFLLKQRKQVENDAMASGYVTKLNILEIKKVNGISMLIEDFNATNGNNSGRSYGMKTIVKSVIYEFTVAGINNNDFSVYKGYLDKIINSFSLKK